MSIATIETAQTADAVGVSTTLGQLLAAVKAASSAIGRRPESPALSHVAVTATGETVTVTGEAVESRNSDSVMESTTATVPAVATVVPGCLLLPAKRLLDMLTAAGKRAPKKVSDAWTVSIAAMDGKAMVDVNGSAFTLATAPTDMYPAIPVTDGPDALTLDTVELIRIMDAAAVAASKDDTLPILTAIKMEVASGVLTLLTTDRYRLFISETPVDADGEHEALVPAKWWAKTKRHLDKKTVTSIRFHSDYISLHNGNNVFTSKNIEGDFPKVRTLFPDRTPTNFTMDADVLLSAAASVAVACERNTPIRLTYTANGTLTLEGGSEDTVASATVQVISHDMYPKDAPFVVAFNPHYLLECLKLFKGQQITFGHTQPGKPAVLSADDSARYLLMPVCLLGQ